MLKSEDHSPSSKKSALARWIYRTIGFRGVVVRYRLQGNNLHVLCEGASCPNRTSALLRFVSALQKTDINALIPAEHPQIYQVFLYGRRGSQGRPNWTAPIYLNQLDRHLAQLRQPQIVQPELVSSAASNRAERSPAATEVAPAETSVSTTAGPSALVLSNRSLAKRGQVDAIARYLSETLSALGVAVKVNARTIPYLERSTKSSTQPAAVSPAVTAATPAVKPRRLWITCEATYSPDPLLISEPIAKQLRELELEGFRDAITLIQVIGEANPDWALRVDLTPTQELLREWARWGDVEAIRRVLGQSLTSAGITLATASLKDATLHLFFEQRNRHPSRSASQPSAPDRNTVHTLVTPILESLGPQGIHAAALYGQLEGQEAPAWVDWLELPAANHPALAEPATILAQQGDWDAIAFLLNRVLNPDLDQQLATGGVRLQLLPKNDLLHVMIDAPTCPEQQRVGAAIAQCLRGLNIPGITGVRAYGRRAGQKRPLWSYGADFTSRHRLVPEATPEFAATDAYIGELISKPDDLIIRPDLTPADLQGAWVQTRTRFISGIQDLLVRSSLFAPASDEQSLSSNQFIANNRQAAKIGLVWGAVGLLLLVQADWMLGNVQVSRSQAEPTPAPEVVAPPDPPPDTTTDSELPLPDVSWNKSAIDAPDAFNPSGFTSPGDAIATDDSADNSASLDTEDTDPILRIAPSALDISFSTFNSRQLDEKIALYQQFLEQYGPPDVLIIGSSRALRGVDPAVLRQALSAVGYEDVTIFNFGVNGATAQVVDLVLRQLLPTEHLPRLIVWADGARALNSGAVDVTYNGITVSEGYQDLVEGQSPIPSSTGQTPLSSAGAGTEGSSLLGGINTSLTSSYQTIDRWLSEQLASVSTAWHQRDRLKSLLGQALPVLEDGTNSAPLALEPEDGSTAQGDLLLQNGQGMTDVEGFMPLSVQFNPATYYQQYARVAGEYDSDYENFQIQGKQADALQSIIQFTQAKNIPIIFVNLPLTQQYLDPVRLKHEQEFKQYMFNLAVSNPKFIFRDLGELWLDQYDYFSDPSHLNRYGAYEISNRLAQDPMIPWGQSAPQMTQ